MTDLREKLELLGLSQYLETFIHEGFDTWDILCDITESDLQQLNVKLGHRRKLQRAIAEARGQPPDKALPNDPKKAYGGASDDSGPENREQPRNTSLNSNQSGPGAKRKYRRHPKPDPHAPERPPSAYVIFSNQVREDLKDQELSFTEIAKIVGERWQLLTTKVKESCEAQANLAKEDYYSKLTEYKKTAEYAQYQEYLVEFRAKYGPNRAVDGKRSKLDTETSPIIGGSDVNDRSLISRSAPELSTGFVLRSSASSPRSTGVPGLRRPSSSASPALLSENAMTPIKPDPYSPGRVSPGLQGNFRRQMQPPNSTYFPSYPRTTSPIPPPLVHADSTVSSDSHASSLGPILTPTESYQIPPLGNRTLPAPVSISRTPLDKTIVHGSNITLPPITTTTAAPQRASGFTALLRATEIAREAAFKGPDQESP